MSRMYEANWDLENNGINNMHKVPHSLTIKYNLI